MEQQLEIITKKKKKRLYFILDDLQKDISEDTIRLKLYKIMKYYIGEENKISLDELFYRVYGIYWDTLDPYKANYLVDVLKLYIRKMRHNNEIFIINKKMSYFVLQNQDEAESYKKVLDRDILSMKQAKVKADNWVREELWRNLFK